jgi:hypothetical protein
MDRGFHGIGDLFSVGQFPPRPPLAEALLAAGQELGYPTDIDISGRNYIKISQPNSNEICLTLYVIRGKVKVKVMVMGMCTEHRDKSVYRLTQTRLCYLSTWLKIGNG